MAVPFDNATTFLTTLSEMARTVYADKFPEMFGRFGAQTAKIFKFKGRKLDGNGITYQTMVAGMDNARWTRDLNADFGKGRAFEASSFRLNVSEDSTANDLGRCSVSLQVTWNDIQRNYTDEVAAANYMKLLLREATRDMAEKLAMHHHLDQTAQLGAVSGTAKKNDAETMAAATTIGATGGARFVLASGRVSYLKRGTLIDVYTSGNVKRFANPIYVTDYNPKDQSVGVFGTDANLTPSSSIDISAIASTDKLYLSNEFGQGPKLMGNWFSTPTSGENFFGRDRTNPLNRWLLPHFSGPSTSTTFTRTMLDDLANEMSELWEQNDAAGYVLLYTQKLDQRLRNEVQNDVLVNPNPTDADKGKVLAQYGFSGYLYRHPQIGRIMPVVDSFAPPNKARLLRPDDWEMTYVAGSGNGQISSPIQWLPGDGGNSYWYRMESSTPGNGRTTTFKMDGMLTGTAVCMAPKRQAEIANIVG